MYSNYKIKTFNLMCAMRGSVYRVKARSVFHKSPTPGALGHDMVMQCNLITVINHVVFYCILYDVLLYTGKVPDNPCYVLRIGSHVYYY